MRIEEVDLRARRLAWLQARASRGPRESEAAAVEAGVSGDSRFQKVRVLIGWRTTEAAPKQAPFDTRAFARFLALQRLSDESIRAFAEKHGRLGVCTCGEPLRAEGAHCDPRIDPLSLCPSPSSGEPKDWEPIDAWRRFSREANAILASERLLRRGELTGLPVDDRSPGARLLADMPTPWVPVPAGLDEARQQLTERVAIWLRSSPVHPTVSTSAGVASSSRASAGLLGPVGVELLQRLTGRAPLAECAVCERPLGKGKASRLTCGSACRKQLSLRGEAKSRTALIRENQQLRRELTEMRAIMEKARRSSSAAESPTPSA